MKIDYSQKSNWYQIPDITKDVDTFYVYATEYIATSLEEGAPDYAEIDNAEMLEGVVSEYALQASVFADSTNVFVPYYRQSGLKYAGEVHKRDGNIDAALSTTCYDDVTDALDYYFENCNNGRPFIIAGHSQGSAIVRLVLKKYFKEHPDYYDRMVAAYPIGYSFTKEDFEKYPHMKFATGELDTGVIVTWNTEGPKNVEVNAPTVVLLPGAISINPINWKRDETYAPASENLGSLMVNAETGEITTGDNGADAQINLARGTVVTHAKADLSAYPEDLLDYLFSIFGPEPGHGDDYTYYYNNIKDNVAKRIAAFMANR